MASVPNRAILRGMFWVAVFLLLAKAIVAGKEITMAYRYGTSAAVDGYLFVFNVSQWPVSIFASVTATILIPYLVKLQKNQITDARRFQDALLSLSLLVGIVAGVLYGLIMWWALGLTGLGLTAQSQAAAFTALPWVAAGIAFAFMSVVLSNWLMSQHRHVNTLLEATPAGVIIVCLLIWPFPAGRDWDIWPLAIGTLLGFLLQTVLLGSLCRQKLGFAHLGVTVQHWKALRRAFVLVLLAQIVFSSSDLLDQFLAVRMGEGVLAGYSYAQRITALVLGLMAVVTGRAMLPVFSCLHDMRLSFIIAARWAWRFAGLGTLIALALFIMAEWVVMLLFERGAFTANDTYEVAQVTRILALQLPFFLFGIVLVQWLSAVGKAAWLLHAAVIGFVVKLLGVLLWFDHGAQGLAASTVLMYSSTTVLIYGTAHIALKTHI